MTRPQNRRAKQAQLTPAMKAKQWRKGQSGNPGGRPKKLPITDRYLAQCEETLPDDICRKAGLKRGSKWGDLITKRIVMEAALKGNVKAATELTDRVEGKAPQRLELSVPEPVTVHVVFDEDDG